MTEKNSESVFDWLYREYGAKFSEHYFDPETEAAIKGAQAAMKQATALAAVEGDPIKKLELMLQARDGVIECTQLLHAQTHRVYLGVIALLAKQVSAFAEPALPKEFRAYLDLQHKQ